MNPSNKLLNARVEAEARGERTARVDLTQAEWDELQRSMGAPIINHLKPGEETPEPYFNLVVFVDGEHVSGSLD